MAFARNIRFKRASFCNVYSHTSTRYYKRCLSTAVAPKPLSDMPGPSTLPLFGPLLHFLPVVGSIGPKKTMTELMESLYEQYGNYVKLEGIFARKTLVVVYEPDDIDQIFRNENVTPSRDGFETQVYHRTVLRKEKFDGVYGLTTAQGAQWRDFRTKVNPTLLMPNLVKLYAPAIEEVANDMVERIHRLNQEDAKALASNINLEMNKWAFESVSLVALGQRLGCLQDDLPDTHPARQLFKCIRDTFDLTFKLEFRPSLWKHFATPNFKKLMAAYDTQLRISEMYIEEAKKSIESRTTAITKEDKSVIERLLEIDQKVAVMMAADMLFAGIDTVSFTMVSLLNHLALNPDKQEKLRTEVRSSQKRPYLKACIKESMRIRPVLSSNLRGTTKEHIVGGYRIPEGVDVILPHEFLCGMDKYYPRAKEFIPERWMVDKNDPLYYGNTHPMVTMPFGFGVRTCIGRRIAESEIEILAAKLVDRFEIGWEGKPCEMVSKVINCFQGPFNFVFKDAK